MLQRDPATRVDGGAVFSASRACDDCLRINAGHPIGPELERAIETLRLTWP